MAQTSSTAKRLDVVAAASERTAEVLAARGIDRRLIEVCYIGTGSPRKRTSPSAARP